MGSVETIAGFGGLVLTAGVLTLVAVGAVVVGVLVLIPNLALLPVKPLFNGTGNMEVYRPFPFGFLFFFCLFFVSLFFPIGLLPVDTVAIPRILRPARLLA